MNSNTEVLDDNIDKVAHTKQLIIFDIATQKYAFFIEEVNEVLATPPVSKLPLAPSFIKGLANIRGNVFTLLDLEDRFDIKPSASDENLVEYPFTLLLNTQNIQLGILLRLVPDTLEIPEDNIDMTPVLMRDSQTDKSYIKGIIRNQDQLILLLDGGELAQQISNK